MMCLPIYIAIDGTLTDSPGKPAPAHRRRIQAVKTMIANGEQIIIWSARGGEYAEKFASDNNLQVFHALGKPQFCVDDNPTIRPGFRVWPPSWLDT